MNEEQSTIKEAVVLDEEVRNVPLTSDQVKALPLGFTLNERFPKHWAKGGGRQSKFIGSNDYNNRPVLINSRERRRLKREAEAAKNSTN